METDNLHPINTEEIKPLQWAIKITDLEDSSSDLSVSTTGIEPLLDSTDDRTKEHDAAMRAKRRKGTLLRTDTDKEYLNTPGKQHAEIMFIKDRSNNPNDITTLWIKNSPCDKCSKALRKYFEDHHKPTIYVGKIWRFDNINDDQELINLMKAGFKIKVWETIHKLKYRLYNETVDHLHKLETQARGAYY